MIRIDHITDVFQHTDGLEAIVFDLDDTLYSEKQYVWSGYREIAKQLPQIEYAERKLQLLFKEEKSAIDELLKQEGIYTEDLKQKCLQIYRYQKPDIILFEGVKDILIELRKKKYKLGIITDGRPEGQRAKIEVLGLETLVDRIIVTDELGGIEFRKPNAKAFQLMKEQLDVEYDQMCYVGDNIKKDFIAPEQLRMKAIWFHNKDGIYA